MRYTIDTVEIELLEEAEWVRVKTNFGINSPIRNQTIDEIQERIKSNYQIVKDHYQFKVCEEVLAKDIDQLSLRIVIFYFVMYNNWRSMYKREKNRDLTFVDKDFKHPYTKYEIINYFKSIYPDNFANKCQVLLDLTQEEFQNVYRQKVQFDTM